MNYEWNPGAAASNRAKHGVSFADAVVVFSDPLAVTIGDESSADEERLATIGSAAFGTVFVVV